MNEYDSKPFPPPPPRVALHSDGAAGAWWRSDRIERSRVSAPAKKKASETLTRRTEKPGMHRTRLFWAALLMNRCGYPDN